MRILPYLLFGDDLFLYFKLWLYTVEDIRESSKFWPYYFLSMNLNWFFRCLVRLLLWSFNSKIKRLFFCLAYSSLCMSRINWVEVGVISFLQYWSNCAGLLIKWYAIIRRLISSIHWREPIECFVFNRLFKWVLSCPKLIIDLRLGNILGSKYS